MSAGKHVICIIAVCSVCIATVSILQVISLSALLRAAPSTNLSSGKSLDSDFPLQTYVQETPPIGNPSERVSFHTFHTRSAMASNVHKDYSCDQYGILSSPLPSDTDANMTKVPYDSRNTNAASKLKLKTTTPKIRPHDDTTIKLTINFQIILQKKQTSRS